jgi:hypothetical protein
MGDTKRIEEITYSSHPIPERSEELRKLSPKQLLFALSRPV